MTTKQLVAIEKEILPELPGFTIKGRLMFFSRIEQVLRGLYFDSSGFDKKSFYVEMFALPLCVPTKDIYFNFGKRMRHANAIDGWSRDEPTLIESLRSAVKANAVPFLSKVQSLEDFVEVEKSFAQGTPHSRQAIAFGLARLGKGKEATRVLDELLDQIDQNVPWQVEIADQALLLKTKLENNPEDAQSQLGHWEHETVRNLGLEAFTFTPQ